MSNNTNELKTRTPSVSSLVRGDAVRRLMETKSERGRGLAYNLTSSCPKIQTNSRSDPKWPRIACFSPSCAKTRPS